MALAALAIDLHLQRRHRLTSPQASAFATATADRLRHEMACQSKLRRSEDWSGRSGSNRRHSAWEADVLPLNYARASHRIANGSGTEQLVTATLLPSDDTASRNVTRAGPLPQSIRARRN